MNVNHYVSVTPLRCYWEGARLVGVDPFCQLVDFDKNVVWLSNGNKFGGASSVPGSIFISIAGLTFVDLTLFLCPFMCPF